MPGCIALLLMVGCSCRGASRVRRNQISFTCPIASWWTRRARCTSATGKNNRIQVFSAEGKFLRMWSDMRRPLDISMDREGIFYISEGGVDGLSPRVSLMDKHGNVVARWDSLSAHGSWVDAHGDIYMALGARERID